MIQQKEIVNLRNRGAAVITGVLVFAATGATVIAQDAKKGLEAAVPEDSGNRVDIFTNGGLFERVVNVLLFLVGAISVIMLIIGGIRYIVSAGDQNQVTGAKNTIMYAIVGIIVAVVAYGIVNYLLTKLYPST